MGVLLQAFYQRGTRGVPSPADGEKVDFWWDHLAKQAKTLRQAGFTAVWLPPVNKGASGGLSIGYDVFDDYDIGSRNQKGTIPTRYGSREQLARCAAVFRANGLDIYLDLVENQRSGGTGPGGFTFRYKDADGNPDGGRFPKNPLNFHPNVPEDPGTVPGQDFSFGSDLAPINGLPKGYVFDNLINAADWLTRALDVQGYRLDDVKGVSTDFMRPLLESKSLQGKFAVGEYFDGNLGLIQQWLFGGMRGRASAFDFPTRFMLQQMCNRTGPFNMSSLDHAGLAGSNPLNAVTFVENHDTDSHGFEAIVQNKMLGYAYILTSEGYPCVFYKDYSTDAGCYKLRPFIDPLIFIHEKLAGGATQQRFKDFDLFAYERLGGPHLLTALNNDSQNGRTITVNTGFGPNVGLHDYTGHGKDIQTDGHGNVTLTVPKNLNGLGYVCYSRKGLESPFDIQSHAVTQTFDGAQDLDIKPAHSNQPVDISRFWPDPGKPIEATLGFAPDQAGPAATLQLELVDPSGAVVTSKSFAMADSGKALKAKTTATGWHLFRITGSNFATGVQTLPFALTVNYTGPQKL
jgi:alpha-amylase